MLTIKLRMLFQNVKAFGSLEEGEEDIVMRVVRYGPNLEALAQTTLCEKFGFHEY